LSGLEVAARTRGRNPGAKRDVETDGIVNMHTYITCVAERNVEDHSFVAAENGGKIVKLDEPLHNQNRPTQPHIDAGRATRAAATWQSRRPVAEISDGPAKAAQGDG
jgi:hypothetical protein